MLPHLPDSESHQETLQGHVLGTPQRLQEQIGGTVGESLERQHLLLGQLV